jgi:glycosyltransferase involved in cell wall biosynthesis
LADSIEFYNVRVPVRVDALCMRLLRCIWSLNPELGGVQEAVRSSSLGLREMGHSVELICLDEPSAPWLRDYPVKVHALGPTKLVLRGVSLVPYGYSGQYVRWMRTHAGKYDAILVEGVWQFPGVGTWLALRGSGIPYFVYIHNMLDPWFKKEYPIKHIKKWVYWLLFEYRVLRDACAVLYTSELEKALAKQSFPLYRAKEAVTGLAIDVPLGNPHYQRQLFFNRFPKLKDKRLILFMGRLHPIKGCDLLIDALARVSHIDSSLRLVMAGPGPVGYMQELQSRVVELGLESKVTWTGMLAGDHKWGAFHAAEALILPSRSEGWPVAVVEAMAYSVPVLISNQVRIWPEIQASGGGLVATDDVDGVTELLKKWLGFSSDERESMKRKAREGYVRRFASSVALERLIYVLQAFGVQEGSGVE